MKEEGRGKGKTNDMGRREGKGKKKGGVKAKEKGNRNDGGEAMEKGQAMGKERKDTGEARQRGFEKHVS